MPPDIRDALAATGLADAYTARPPYQRNDYLSWVTRAVRPATRQKRLDQMLRDLEACDAYMGMAWHSR